jgi:hypothetical protein
VTVSAFDDREFRSVVRHSVERVLGAARAADPHVDRPARAGQAPLPRPLSTGNLLADCERWCRDHLSPRSHREADAGALVQLANYRSAS